MLDLFENLCTELCYGSLSGRAWNWVGKHSPRRRGQCLSTKHGFWITASVEFCSLHGQFMKWSLTRDPYLFCLFMSQPLPRCSRYSCCCQDTRPPHSKVPFSSTLNWKCFHIPECSQHPSAKIPSIFIFFCPFSYW